MNSEQSRRGFLSVAGTAVAAGMISSAAAQTKPGGEASGRVKILAVNGSPRKGKTTAAALELCLQAAREVSPRIETALIELGGMKIDGLLAVAGLAPEGATDDFDGLIPKLSDPAVGGIILGAPVYFGSPPSLCKAFLERWMVFRKGGFSLSNKVAGVVAVGGARNGGQELVIQCIQAAMMCHEMLIVGDGRPTAHRGATLWNNKDDISADEFGIGTAKNLGRRVAEVALQMAHA